MELVGNSLGNTPCLIPLVFMAHTEMNAAYLTRKDIYEKNVNVYWVQSNLRGKKLSLGTR
jgi:hypothetical protein